MTADSAIRLDSEAIKVALSDPATLGLSLTVIMESTFEPAVLYGSKEHDPLDVITIMQTLEENYGVSLPPALENRIQAIMLLRTTAAFENDLRAFVAITLSLADGYLGDMPTGVMEDVEIGDALWAVFESACIDPGMQPLSAEVETHIMELEAAPAETNDAGEAEDDMGDVMRRMDVLQQQLLALGVPASIIDTLFERGSTALQHAQTQE